MKIQHPQLFFSRTDSDSLEKMHNLFNRNGIFFIEKKLDQTWLHEDWVKSDVIETTNDPHKAKRFETQNKAITYLVENDICNSDMFIITEHIFDYPKSENKKHILK